MSLEEIQHRLEVRPIDPIPADKGVYFLAEKDELVYIGQSATAWNRLNGHKEKEFSRAFFMSLAKSQLDDVEGALIRLYSPRLNKTSGPGNSRNDAKVLDELFAGKIPANELKATAKKNKARWLDEQGPRKEDIIRLKLTLTQEIINWLEEVKRFSASTLIHVDDPHRPIGYRIGAYARAQLLVFSSDGLSYCEVALPLYKLTTQVIDDTQKTLDSYIKGKRFRRPIMGAALRKELNEAKWGSSGIVEDLKTHMRYADPSSWPQPTPTMITYDVLERAVDRIVDVTRSFAAAERTIEWYRKNSFTLFPRLNDEDDKVLRRRQALIIKHDEEAAKRAVDKLYAYRMQNK